VMTFVDPSSAITVSLLQYIFPRRRGFPPKLPLMMEKRAFCLSECTWQYGGILKGREGECQ